jgi:hypothetical protein
MTILRAEAIPVSVPFEIGGPKPTFAGVPRQMDILLIRVETERSQQQNRATAMHMLRARLREAEQNRLIRQARIMGEYSAVLGERIAHFGEQA